MNADDMDALVTTTANRIGRAWLIAIAHLREQNTVESIAYRMHVSDPLLGVRDAAMYFAAQEHAGYVHAGQATARWLDAQVAKHHTGAVPRADRIQKKLGGFDIAAPPAVAWAERNQLDKIREIEEDVRNQIRAILIAGARSGENPLVVAKQIRETIGLTEHQVGIVDGYRRSLESGQYSAALSRELSSGVSDKTIAAALRNETRLTQAQIDKAVDRYRDNMLTMRAEAIARTEGLRVAHQGSEELYRQAAARGDIEAEQIERTWHHSPGAKNKKNERAFHRSMEGQTRKLGELFQSGIGGLLRYPGDPEADPEETVNCRCALSTRVVPGARAGAQVPGGGGEEVEVADPAALEEEAAAAEEEAAAAEEQAAAEEAAAAAQVAADEAAAEESAVAAEAETEAAAEQIAGDLVPDDAEQRLAAATAAHEQATAELEAAQRAARRARRPGA